jgi:hypothetical protein
MVERRGGREGRREGMMMAWRVFLLLQQYFSYFLLTGLVML